MLSSRQDKWSPQSNKHLGLRLREGQRAQRHPMCNGNANFKKVRCWMSLQYYLHVDMVMSDVLRLQLDLLACNQCTFAMQGLNQVASASGEQAIISQECWHLTLLRKLTSTAQFKTRRRLARERGENVYRHEVLKT